MADAPNRAYHVGVEFTANSGYVELRSRAYEVNVNRQMADVFRPLGAGTCEIVLDNTDGHLSPESTVSTWAGRMRPGLNVRVWGLYDSSSGNVLSVDVSSVSNPNSPPAGISNIYPLFTGAVDEWVVDPKLAGPRQTILRCRDVLRTIVLKQLNPSLNTEYNVTSLFVDVLSLAGIATTARSVQAIDDAAKYTYFDPDTPALDVVSRIIESGDYYTFVDGAGIVQVKDRNFTQGLTVVASYQETYDLSYSLSDDGVANIVRISAEPREPSAAVEVVAQISSGTPITLAGSSFVSFFLDYIDPVTLEGMPANSATTPVASTDYYLTTNSLGTGTNRTTTTSVNVVFFATTAVCSLFNGHSDTIYLNRFRLRAFGLHTRSPIVSEQKDSSSQAVYGDRTLTIVNNLIGTQEYGDAYAQYLLELRKNPVPDIRGTLRNSWPDVMQRDLGQSVYWTNDLLGLAQQFTVFGVGHHLRGLGEFTHDCTLDLERARDFELLYLDSATLGLLDSRRLGA